MVSEGVSILSNEVQESEAFGAAESLIASRIQALLCVPLMLFDRTVGVIYLYASDPQTRFDQDHLQLLTAIAGIAAVALYRSFLDTVGGAQSALGQVDIHGVPEILVRNIQVNLG